MTEQDVQSDLCRSCDRPTILTDGGYVCPECDAEQSLAVTLPQLRKRLKALRDRHKTVSETGTKKRSLTMSNDHKFWCADAFHLLAQFSSRLVDLEIAVKDPHRLGSDQRARKVYDYVLDAEQHAAARSQLDWTDAPQAEWAKQAYDLLTELRGRLADAHWCYSQHAPRTVGYDFSYIIDGREPVDEPHRSYELRHQRLHVFYEKVQNAAHTYQAEIEHTPAENTHNDGVKAL